MENKKQSSQQHSNQNNINLATSDSKVEQYKNKKLRKKKQMTKDEFNHLFKGYFKKQNIKDFFRVLLAAFLATIAYDYFIASTTKYGIFPAGVSAISRILAIITFNNNEQWQNGFYFVYYLAFNIPLFIFGYFKVGKRFSVYTLIYILLQNAIHFSIASIPYVNAKDMHFIINYGSIQDKSSVGRDYQLWLFVFATFAAVIFGASYGILYRAGGSSGGTDFISAYYSLKNHKSIANINRYINFCILMIVSIITTIRLDESAIKKIFAIENISWSFGQYRAWYFFGPSLFASLIFIILQAAITNTIFPRYRYRSLMILSYKAQMVFDSLKFAGYNNEILRWKANSCFVADTNVLQELEIISVSVTLIEYKKIKASILVADPDAKIFIQKLQDVVGNFIPCSNIK